MNQLPIIGRTRFAPTPSGQLHLGNALNFVLTWVMAKSYGLDIFLRLDDCDRSRYRDVYALEIFDMLGHLGLNYQIGPRNIEEFEAQFSQDKRSDYYLSQMNPLIKEELGFYCQCSRKNMRQDSSNAIYGGNCRSLGLNEGVYRLDLAKALEKIKDILNSPSKKYKLDIDSNLLQKKIGDAILIDRFGKPNYQFVSVVDDCDYKMTHILRGMDLIPSTELQKLLAVLLNKDEFLNIRFIHHDLIWGPMGSKLSKSENADSLKFYLEKNGAEGFYGQFLTHTLRLFPKANIANDLLGILPKGYFDRNYLPFGNE